MALLTTASPDLRFGVDYSTFHPVVLADGTSTLTFGLTYTKIYGPRVPLEHVARRWLTTRGDLFWAPNAGQSVLRLLNNSMLPSRLTQFAAQLAKEAQTVDYVSRAHASIRYVGTTLTISGTITLVTSGTYPLAVGITAAGPVLAQFPLN